MRAKMVSHSSYQNIYDLEDKLFYLRNHSLSPIPDEINAIMVFGSHRSETILKVIDFLQEHPEFKMIPIIISGRGNVEQNNGLTEAESYYYQLRAADIMNPIYLDTTAENTEENVQNMLSILNKLNIPAKNIVTFNFAVLNRCSQYYLKEAGLEDFYSLSSDIISSPDENYNEALLELKDWINFHYNKLKELSRERLLQPA